MRVRTGEGCVDTGNAFWLFAKDGSIPARSPLATCIVRVSTDVRTKISSVLTFFRKPSFLLYSAQKSCGAE